MVTNYALIKNKEAVLGCCNAVYGCNFTGKLTAVQEHEMNCKLRKCLMKHCCWQGFDNCLLLHLITRHQIVPNKIEINEERVRDSTFLTRGPGKYGTCSESHFDQALFVVQTVVDNTNKTVKIGANHVELDGVKLTGGYIKVTMGKIVYKGDIGRITGKTVDINSEIHICRLLFKQYKVLTIELLDC